MPIMRLTLALSMLVIAASAPAQDLAGPLRQGIVEEDANRNLDAAIRDYQSVLTRFAEERKTAATALFRLAECYRKQGNAQQANAAYNRLLAEFSDQSELAAQSRKALGKPTMPPPPPPASAGGQVIKPLSTEVRLAQLRALQERLDIAVQNLMEVQKQMDLGAVGAEAGNDAQVAVIRARRALAEFEGHRDEVRQAIWQELDLARKSLAEEEKRYQLGLVPRDAVNRRRLAVIDLEAELAGAEASK